MLSGLSISIPLHYGHGIIHKEEHMVALFNWVELLIADVVITFFNFISQFSGDF